MSLSLKIRRFSSEKWFPMALIVVVVLTYGMMIGRFSFYGDDWIYVYNNHLTGPSSFKQFVAWDRPFSAWIYALTGFLFAEKALPYHLLLLAQRYIAAFLFWKILSRVWSRQWRTNAIAALLFAVYPGFQQQPIAVQYILHFASLDLCLFSINCMMNTTLHFRNGRRKAAFVWMMIGFLSSTVALFSCEYFVGLEVARPFLLWAFLCGMGEMAWKKREKIGLFFKNWAPYFLSSLIFLFWRVFIFSFQTYQPKMLTKLTEQPAQALSELVKKIAADLYVVLVSVWRKTLTLQGGRDFHVSLWLVAGAVFLLAYFMLWNSANEPSRANGRDWQIFGVGVIGLIGAGIPFWTTMINVETEFPWDRSTLSFSPAVAMITASILSLCVKNMPQVLVAALLCALAVNLHLNNGLIYIRESAKMNDYFWQLSWRAPELENGTIIVSENIPLNRYSDNDLTPVLDWQYAPDNRGYFYQYKYFDLDLREDTFFARAERGIPISHTYRSHQFNSSTDKTLAVYYEEGHCLWVITDKEKDYPGLPDSIHRLSALSNSDVIMADSETPATPPEAIGLEPEHGFCYAFQRIALALQQGDTARADEMAMGALNEGLTPSDTVDWIPFLRAFIRNGNWSGAETVARKIDAVGNRQKYICEQIKQEDWAATQSEGNNVLLLAGCEL